jgi:hypothetical protein
MRRQLLFVLAAGALVVALAAAAAQAKPSETLSLTPANITFGPETAACPLGTVEFDVQSPAGAPLGTGTGCIQAIDPVGTSAQRARVVFTFELAGGSLTVAARLKETFLSETSFIQRAHGKILAGTGKFADAHGKLRGGGTIVFNPDGSIDSSVVFALTWKGGDAE